MDLWRVVWLSDVTVHCCAERFMPYNFFFKLESRHKMIEHASYILYFFPMRISFSRHLKLCSEESILSQMKVDIKDSRVTRTMSAPL